MSRPKIGPLFDEDTSYKKTGIPCGNSRRYESKGVLRMAPDGRRPFRDQRLEAPAEDIETEGDRQLQQLLGKQLKKDVSLHEHLAKKKIFTAPTVERPVVGETSGTLSLEKFKDVETRVDHINELKQLGLTDDEVEIKLRSEGLDRDGKPLAKRSKFGEDPSIFEAKLKAVETKIASKLQQLDKPDTFSGAKFMSRHEMDLERAISHDQQTAKSLSILMTDVKSEAESRCDDPMDHIKKLLEKVESGQSKMFIKPEKQRQSSSESSESEDVDEPPTCLTFKDFMRKSKEELRGKAVTDVPQSECPDCARSTHECYYHSRRNKDIDLRLQLSNDSVISPTNIEDKRSSLSESTDKPKKKRKQKQKEKRLVLQPSEADLGNQDTIPIEVIEKYRITVDEIKQMERFSNYSPGEPTETLFVKNLSGKVTEGDLRSIFQLFAVADASPISYRLLTGRMKGQAFVTFPDITSSTAALNTVNGYSFKGKPIIIQFGKKIIQPSYKQWRE